MFDCLFIFLSQKQKQTFSEILFLFLITKAFKKTKMKFQKMFDVLFYFRGAKKIKQQIEHFLTFYFLFLIPRAFKTKNKFQKMFDFVIFWRQKE